MGVGCGGKRYSISEQEVVGGERDPILDMHPLFCVLTSDPLFFFFFSLSVGASANKIEL